MRRDIIDVSGKVVRVTGASEGIGAATATLLAARGATVALAARSIDKLKTLTAVLDASLAIQADMSVPESITSMVDAVVEHYCSINVLVKNAGRALRAPVANIKLPDFKNIVELNVYGPLFAMQACHPTHHAPAGRGSIVNVSSNVSKMAIPSIGPYAATKYAFNGTDVDRP